VVVNGHRDAWRRPVTNDHPKACGLAFQLRSRRREILALFPGRHAPCETMNAILARKGPHAPLYRANLGYLLRTSVHGWRSNRPRAVVWRQLWLEPTK
jgi:hypothetical protein